MAHFIEFQLSENKKQLINIEKIVTINQTIDSNRTEIFTGKITFTVPYSYDEIRDNLTGKGKLKHIIN